MKWPATCRVAVILLSAVAWSFGQASGEGDPSDMFLRAYQRYQAGEKLEGEGSPQRALASYREAEALLGKIQQAAGDWQPLVVEYRLKRTRENIARLEVQTAGMPPLDDELEGPLPSGDPAPRTGPALPAITTAPSGPRAPRPPPAREAPADSALSNALRELAAVRKQLADAEKENQRIQRRAEKVEAELKSALTEIDRTKVTVVELRSQLAQTTDALDNLRAERGDFAALRAERDKETAAFLKRLAEAGADAEVLREENEALFAKLEAAANYISASDAIREDLLTERKKLAADRSAAEAARDKAVADFERSSAEAASAKEEVVAAREEASAAKAELAALRAANADLEKALAEARAAGASRQELDRLAAQNKELEKKLAAAEKRAGEAGSRSPAVEALQSDLNTANDRLLEAQSELSQRDLRIEELVAQLDEVSGELARLKLLPVPSSEEQRLLAENDLLRGIILRQIQVQNRRDEARQALEAELTRLGVAGDAVAAPLAELAAPVLELTAEERSLFKDPVALLVEPEPSKLAVGIAITQPTGEEAAGNLEAGGERGASALGEEARELVRKAQEFFDEKNYSEAEKTYQRIVELAPENYFALANLGAVQIEAGKLAAAEVALEKAISLSPDDAFAHTHLGIVRSRQGRFPDARVALERALAINPRDAIAHNYLGVCLAQQGDRETAEEHLKTSIGIDPGYANAHFNLAVLYATTKPPFIELAKQHYQRATQLGAQPDASLERLIQ